MGFLDFIKGGKSLLESGLLQAASDRHSHILFGVDDGVQTLEESLEVLAFYEKVGIKEVWCTPHIMEDVPNRTEELRVRFAQLTEAYGGTVKLHLAAEYMLDTLFEECLESGDLLLMDDDTLLVETSTWNPPSDMKGVLARIKRSGFHPLLAHPERYRYLDLKAYEELKRMGVRFQLNLGSLSGYYGDEVRDKARILLKNGWYNAIGSDCHRLRSIREQFERKSLTSGIIRLLKEIHT